MLKRIKKKTKRTKYNIIALCLCVFGISKIKGIRCKLGFFSNLQFGTFNMFSSLQ